MNSHCWTPDQDKMEGSVKLISDVLKCVIPSSFFEGLRCHNSAHWELDNQVCELMLHHYMNCKTENVRRENFCSCPSSCLRPPAATLTHWLC